MRAFSVQGVIQLGVGLAVVVLIGVLSWSCATTEQSPAESSPTVMPQYDGGRNLIVPPEYRTWVLVGSSLGLSYAPADASEHTMFNSTLMEPTAYRHFVGSGTFREGTMLALVFQGVGSTAAPLQQGQFASDIHALEMAVKDSTRVPEGWAYYRLGGPMTGDYLQSASPQPKADCYACHVQHAAKDNVFTQFYGLLNDVAPKTPERRSPD